MPEKFGISSQNPSTANNNATATNQPPRDNDQNNNADQGRNGTGNAITDRVDVNRLNSPVPDICNTDVSVQTGISNYQPSSEAQAGPVDNNSSSAKEDLEARYQDAMNRWKTIGQYGGNTSDYAKQVLSDLKDLAVNENYAGAQSCLGDLYKFGELDGFPNGESVTYQEAAKWYRRAADQGYAHAQNALGYMYEEGQIEGSERRGAKADQEAAKWYQRAAEQNHRLAQEALGRMYQEGRIRGFPKGGTKANLMAIKWFQKSAAQGRSFWLERELPKLHIELAHKYLARRSNTQWHEDCVVGFKHLFRARQYGGLYEYTPLAILARYMNDAVQAATKGDANAQKCLMDLYSEAMSPDQSQPLELGDSKEQLLYLFGTLALSGHSRAQYLIASAYMDGSRRPSTDSQAAKLFFESARGGSKDSLDVVQAVFTGQQQNLPVSWEEERVGQLNGALNDAYTEEYQRLNSEKKSQEEASKLRQEFAELGCGPAQHSLAQYHKSKISRLFTSQSDAHHRYLYAKWLASAALGKHETAQNEYKKLGNSTNKRDGALQTQIGLVHERGDGVPLNPDEAKRWYNQAIKSKDPHAKEHLDKLVAAENAKAMVPKMRLDFEDIDLKIESSSESETETETPKTQQTISPDVTRTENTGLPDTDALRLLAKQNDSYAQYRMSCLCREDRPGHPANMKLAAYWLVRSVTEPNSNMDAVNDLNRLYSDGPFQLQFHIAQYLQRGLPQNKGLPKIPNDPSNAALWYQHLAAYDTDDAADQDLLALTQYRYAKILEKGDGLKQNFEEAIEYYRKAYFNAFACESAKKTNYAKGLAEAQFRYAVRLKRGDGVAVDLPKARTYFRKAAVRGYGKARHELALLCFQGGAGISVDENEGAQWLIRAADGSKFRQAQQYKLEIETGNDATKQFAIAQAYEQGIVQEGPTVAVTPNRSEARRFYELARVSGHKDAEKALARLAEQGVNRQPPAQSSSHEVAQGAARDTNTPPKTIAPPTSDESDEEQGGIVGVGPFNRSDRSKEQEARLIKEFEARLKAANGLEQKYAVCAHYGAIGLEKYASEVLAKLMNDAERADRQDDRKSVGSLIDSGDEAKDDQETQNNAAAQNQLVASNQSDDTGPSADIVEETAPEEHSQEQQIPRYNEARQLVMDLRDTEKREAAKNRLDALDQLKNDRESLDLCYALSKVYREGNDPDYHQAMFWLILAKEGNHPQAKIDLERIKHTGPATPRNEAILIYANGSGESINADESEAAAWRRLTPAAEQLNPAIQPAASSGAFNGGGSTEPTILLPGNGGAKKPPGVSPLSSNITSISANTMASDSEETARLFRGRKTVTTSSQLPNWNVVQGQNAGGPRAPDQGNSVAQATPVPNTDNAANAKRLYERACGTREKAAIDLSRRSVVNEGSDTELQDQTRDSRHAARLLEIVSDFKRAANMGHAMAQHEYALCLINGPEAVRQHTKDQDWKKIAAIQLLKAANQTNDAAAAEKANAKINNIKNGDQEALKEAILKAEFDLHKTRANNGSREDMYALFRCYRGDSGDAADLDKAAYWLLRAAAEGANGGYPAATDTLEEIKTSDGPGQAELQFAIGRYYDENDSSHVVDAIPTNYDKAVAFYGKAADNNHAEANYRLGVFGENDRNIGQRSATECFRKAAQPQAGHRGARYRENRKELDNQEIRDRTYCGDMVFAALKHDDAKAHAEIAALKARFVHDSQSQRDDDAKDDADHPGPAPQSAERTRDSLYNLGLGYLGYSDHLTVQQTEPLDPRLYLSIWVALANTGHQPSQSDLASRLIGSAPEAYALSKIYKNGTADLGLDADPEQHLLWLVRAAFIESRKNYPIYRSKPAMEEIDNTTPAKQHECSGVYKTAIYAESSDPKALVEWAKRLLKLKQQNYQPAKDELSQLKDKRDKTEADKDYCYAVASAYFERSQARSNEYGGQAQLLDEARSWHILSGRPVVENLRINITKARM